MTASSTPEAAPAKTSGWNLGRPPLRPEESAGAPTGASALDAVAVALGVALLSATVVLASVRVRADGEVDWSNLTLGLAATVGLLGVAAAAHLALRPSPRQESLVAWPGAFGALAAGLLLVSSVDGDWTPYLGGLVIIALSVVGYRFSGRPAYVVSCTLGLLVVYLKVTDDLFNGLDLDGNENVGLVVGAVLLAFVVMVTAAGWLLPTRIYSGVVAGAIAAVGYVITLVALLIAASFARAFGELGDPAGRQTYHDDAWWLLVFSLVLVALWAFCAWVTGHVGFRLLMVGLTALVVPLATSVLGVQHPTWWELVLGLAGGVVLLTVAWRLRATSTAVAPQDESATPASRGGHSPSEDVDTSGGRF